jgi:tetratricopeptide (TPR) repeat protein
MFKKRYLIIGFVVVVVIIVGLVLAKPYWKSGFGADVLKINTTLTLNETQEKTLSNIKESLAKDPSDYLALLDLAKLKQSLLDNAGAEKMYLKLSKINAADILPLNNLASLYVDTKRYDEAEKTYLAIFNINYKWLNAYQGLYDLYQFQLPERRAKLEPILLKGIEEFPEMKSALLNMTAVYYDELMNDKIKAIEYYKKTIERDPTKKDAKDRLTQLLK